MDNYELTEWTKEKINENVGQIEMLPDVYRFRCPFCGDSRKKANKKRGNYYLKTGSFYCFNCEHSTDSFGLVAELETKQYHEVKAEFFKYEHSGGGSFEYIETFEPAKIDVSTSPDFVIPNTWNMLDKNSQHYIDSRMINQAPNLPKEWKLYFNTETDRLVIPWIKNGKIVYYQERAVYSKQIPKYLFPKDTMNRPMFGLDNIDDYYPWIFYLEGALDSIWIKNGTASGSISLSKSQKSELDNYFGHQIVYFPDNPWVDTASKNKIIKLSETEKDLKVWMWPKEFKEKDVNELICNLNAPDFFYNETMHENIVSVQKARCILALS